MERVLLLLLLLLPLCSCQLFHSQFQGTVMTYYPLSTHPDGSVTVEVRYKSNSKTCVLNDYWCPSEGCWGLSHLTVTIDVDSTRQFCQVESIWTRKGPSNAPILMKIIPNLWTGPLVNGIIQAQALALVELRTRSDTGQTNRSPQTTILPVHQVPWNCQRDIRLLTFDPDGDLLKCRFAVNSTDPTECLQCTPPSVLSLSPPCTLTFSPTGNSTVGWYGVQLVVEDLPRNNINLSLANGTREQRTTNDFISKIPVQFILSVEAAAPSCTEGLYLPRFVDPTPEYGAHLHVNVSQTLQIYIKAEATKATISELLFSGPSRMNKAYSGGQFNLSWTPVATEEGQSHPVCFSVLALFNTSKFSSALRCVIVNVGNASIPPAPTPAPASTTTPVLTTAANTSVTTPLTPSPPTAEGLITVFIEVRISSSVPLSEEVIRTSVLERLREDLVKRGLPPNTVLLLVNGTLTLLPSP